MFLLLRWLLRRIGRRSRGDDNVPRASTVEVTVQQILFTLRHTLETRNTGEEQIERVGVETSTFETADLACDFLGYYVIVGNFLGV